MLERPDIDDSQINDCLRDAYGLHVTQVIFLPIGADNNTAVFKAIAEDESPYFVKLRRNDFDDMSIIVPAHLQAQGMDHLIAPLQTQSKQLWSDLGEFKITVFPFVDGKDGLEAGMLNRHWVEFGQALKTLHTVHLSDNIANRIQKETFPDTSRTKVKDVQEMIKRKQFADPVASELARFLREKTDVVSHLVQRAEHYANQLNNQNIPLVLCHADIHVWNILIDTEDNLYIVDWDTVILAPKEHDLMFIGGGLFGNQRSAEEQEQLFYQGYGLADINPMTLAYYRYERIVQDIAEYCEMLLMSDEGGDDRQNGLDQLKWQFEPDNVIDIAYRTEKIYANELNL